MSPVKIFVGNIASGTTVEEVRELFAQYGQVTECDILGAGNYAFIVSILGFWCCFTQILHIVTDLLILYSYLVVTHASFK